MALSESVEYDKIEIVTIYKSVQVRKATVIKKDGVELTRSFQRYVLEWKEELDRQVKTRDHAKKVFDEAITNINALQGGIQFGELLLKKNESSSQPTGIVELNQQPKQKPRK